MESEHIIDGVCQNWCVLDWYRLYSTNRATPRYRSASTLKVPYGLGEEPDKRRGGTWYLGVQALDEPAEPLTWTCGRCTLFNPLRSERCEACEFARALN